MTRSAALAPEAAALSRRTVLGGIAAAGGLVALARPAAAQFAPSSPFGAPVPGAADLRFTRFAVDTRRIVSPYNDSTAALVARDLERCLAEVFADRAAGRGARGATLMVRISSLFLPPYTGGGNGSGKGNGPDSLEGVGLVVAADRRVLSETPLLATLDPTYSGAWYRPDIAELRVASISYQFAYWLRREMGI